MTGDRSYAEAWVCSCNGRIPLPRSQDLGSGVRLRTFRALCLQDPAPAPEGPVFLGCFRGTADLVARWEDEGRPPGSVVAWDLDGLLDAAAPARAVAAAAEAGAALAAAGRPPTRVDLPPGPRVAVMGPGSGALARALEPHAAVVWIDPEAPPGPPLRGYPARPGGVEGRLGAFRVVPHRGPPVDPWTCVGCGECARACPTGALEPGLRFQADRCDGCGRCEEACASVGALDLRSAPGVPADQVVWVGGAGPSRPGLHLPPDPSRAGEAVAEVLGLVRGAEAWDPLILTERPCAHAASGLRGCDLCLRACPTGALQEGGARIRRDPLACSGCGACLAACPTGSLDSRPHDRDALARALERLGRAGVPTTLRCPGAHRPGRRGGVGIPLEHLYGVDAWALAGAVLAGAPWVAVEPCPSCGPWVGGELDQARRVLFPPALSGRVLGPGDPAPADSTATAPALPPAPPGPEDPLDRRARVLTAVLVGPVTGPPLEGPFGRPTARAGCTGCGACAGVCPTGALTADPDTPVVRVREVRCVGCGLCAQACPEGVVEIAHHLAWEGSALQPRVFARAEAHACPACGRVFATRQALEAVRGRLQGRVAFEPTLLELCPDCRVVRAVGPAR
ncbi:4Fe-4S dicluster domain-containing protein [Deferrisoma camini]|uniref:4Fe-4S dicluster domain-containing protein n=1 Tax=Deferrisoma camini TaxID=1035120 RepID=UPI00146D1340|nr:4Fe-4S dicluster domain-containing protein [Deferrisoma camini]